MTEESILFSAIFILQQEMQSYLLVAALAALSATAIASDLTDALDTAVADNADSASYSVIEVFTGADDWTVSMVRFTGDSLG